MSQPEALTKKVVTCITINTDASFHPKYKVGGFAFYIVCDLLLKLLLRINIQILN